MSINKRKKAAVDFYVKCLNTILVNKELDTDDTTWIDASKEQLTKLAVCNSLEIFCTDEWGMNNEQVFFMCAAREEMSLSMGSVQNKFEKYLEDYAQKRREEKKASGKEDEIQDVYLNIICIVDSIKMKMQIKEWLDSECIKRLKKVYKGAQVNRHSKAIKYNVNFIVETKPIKEDIKLTGISRIDILRRPELDKRISTEAKEKKVDIYGYVMNVKLVQFAELYNKIGDVLFDGNVRYGINEEMGVEKAIIETLDDAPEQFWFRNNGVTIAVHGDDFRLNRTSEVYLFDAKKRGKLNLSVINGAQTITTAANYYYNALIKLEKGKKEECDLYEKKKKNIEKAEIVLRIMHVPGDKRKSDLLKKISVSLNRQKPIKIEDIAYTSEFVEFINRIQDNYRIIKRGEVNQENGQSIDLVTYVRAIMACHGLPSEARNGFTKNLLEQKETTDKGYHFKKDIIYDVKWFEDGKKEEEIFKEKYSAVHYACNVAKKYDMHSKKIKLNSFDEVVLKNGKWYFVSKIINVLNDGDIHNFSNFKNVQIDDNKMIELMTYISSEIADICVKEQKNVASNDFKKAEIYDTAYAQLNNEYIKKIIYGE